jgi:hypothetical protein
MAIFTPDVLDKGLIDITNQWLDKGLNEKESMMQVYTQGHEGHVRQRYATRSSSLVKSSRSPSSSFFSFTMVQQRKEEQPSNLSST